MMEKEFLSLLACPDCKGELSLEMDELKCFHCKEVFHVKDGVPIFGFRESEAFWKEFFNDLSEKIGDSEEANAYFNKKSFEFTKSVLLKAIGEIEDKKIVDIGCGTGHATSCFSEKNIILGVDISLKILYLAKEKGLLPVQSSATKLPFRSNSFEVIICNNLLQTVSEGESVMDEIERISAKGGKVFIVTSNRDGILNRIFSFLERKKYQKMRLYSIGEIASYLKRKGFQIKNFYFLSLPIKKAWKNKGNTLIKIISTSFLIEAEKK